MPFLPDLLESVVINDRQKKLKNTITKHLLTAIYNHYYQYITDNITRRFSIIYIKLFQRTAKAKTKPAFNIIIKQLAIKHPKYTTYLKKIRLESWIYQAFPTRRQLYNTSNVNKSINNIQLKTRSLSALYLLY